MSKGINVAEIIIKKGVRVKRLIGVFPMCGKTGATKRGRNFCCGRRSPANLPHSRYSTRDKLCARFVNIEHKRHCEKLHLLSRQSMEF